MECPHIARDLKPQPEYNERLVFVCDNGFEYIYYKHHDGFGAYYNCQFCKFIGRKRDVFECLNESEWQACNHYKHAAQQPHAVDASPVVGGSDAGEYSGSRH